MAEVPADRVSVEFTNDVKKGALGNSGGTVAGGGDSLGASANVCFGVLTCAIPSSLFLIPSSWKTEWLLWEEWFVSYTDSYPDCPWRRLPTKCKYYHHLHVGGFSSFFIHIICCSLKSNKSLLSLRLGFILEDTLLSLLITFTETNRTRIQPPNFSKARIKSQDWFWWLYAAWFAWCRTSSEPIYWLLWFRGSRFWRF